MFSSHCDKNDINRSDRYFGLSHLVCLCTYLLALFNTFGVHSYKMPNGKDQINTPPPAAFRV